MEYEMPNGWGGKRPVAGRPKGSRNVAGKLRDKAQQMGLCPAEYLLTVVSDESQDTRLRMDAAKAVLPYLWPRLNAVEVSQNQENRSVHQLSTEELLTVIEGESKKIQETSSPAKV
jgi:hypothetical protein